MNKTERETIAAIQHTLKTELLSINPHALQFLHAFHGFDGESPFIIIKTTGRFTHKQILKQIPAEMGDDYSANLFMVQEYAYNGKKKLFHVMITQSGFATPQTSAHYKYEMEYFYAKSRLEEVRKTHTGAVYVIAQKREYHKQRGERKKYPDGMRYIIPEHGITWATTMGDHTRYISRITMIPKTGNGERILYTPHNGNYYGDTVSDNINDYIDKNGYLIYPQKAELRQRARKLKTERERNAVLNSDFSERKTAIYAGLDRIRARIANAILNANTYETAGDVAGTTRAYQWLMLDVERMEKNNFQNMTQAQTAFDNIESKISEILGEGENK
jgi:hypothetical protein